MPAMVPLIAVRPNEANGKLAGFDIPAPCSGSGEKLRIVAATAAIRDA
jgi:hypothetical protein